MCKLCRKPYFGRTIQMICNRMSGHRGCFKKLLQNFAVDLTNVDFSLGLHLMNEHNLTSLSDFEENLELKIVENCSPCNIEKKEHMYIRKYKSLHPCGLNKVNPFGLSLLS